MGQRKALRNYRPHKRFNPRRARKDARTRKLIEAGKDKIPQTSVEELNFILDSTHNQRRYHQSISLAVQDNEQDLNILHRENDRLDWDFPDRRGHALKSYAPKYQRAKSVEDHIKRVKPADNEDTDALSPSKTAAPEEDTSALSPSRTPSPLEEIQKMQKEIEDHKLIIKKVHIAGEDENWPILRDRRVVDIGHFYHQIRRLENHSCPIDPDRGYLSIVKEQRSGLAGVLLCKCEYCGEERKINLVEHAEEINTAAVAGMYALGKGHEGLEEFLTHIGVPCPSYDLFRKLEDRLGDAYYECLSDVIREAGEEERALAIQKGALQDGVPIITVIVDGSWSHRSFGHRYTAKSGCAVVIGKESKQLLYLGVRNKYCSICSIAGRKKEAPPVHECYKNWTGSSPAMEADIICEGFQQSEEMHGLRYGTLIADGDSKVLRTIVEKVPYGRTVLKLECVNHIMKNVKKRLFELQNECSKTESAWLTNQKIKSMTSYVRSLIDKFSADIEKRDDIKAIIQNIGRHYMNDHTHCLPEVCSRSGTNTVIDLDETFQRRVESVIGDITRHTSSIVENQTTNLAEGFMSLISKFTGAKQVFYGRRASYIRRVHNAGLSYTYGQNWRSKVWKTLHKKPPPSIVARIDAKRSRRNILHAARKAEQKEKRLPKYEADDSAIPALPLPYDDQHLIRPRVLNLQGSTQVATPDMDHQTLTVKMGDKLKSLQVDQTAREKIELETRDQADSRLWHEERSDRLTASNFGRVYKRRGYAGSMVKSILYPTKVMTRAMRYGKENEKEAITAFQQVHDKIVRPCGLFVDLSDGFLAASPDGVVIGENAIVEVKCPYTAATTSITELATNGHKDFFLMAREDGLSLKTNHNYFYQIQGQLAITGAELCYFVVWSPNELFVQEVPFDESLWSIMEEKLEAFYKNEMLPELVDSRLRRGLPIRRSRDDDTKEEPVTPRQTDKRTIHEDNRDKTPPTKKPFTTKKWPTRLQNGNLQEAVSLSGQGISIKNTCAFDCVATIIITALLNSQSYAEHIRSTSTSNNLANFCTQVADGAGEAEVDSTRAELLVAEKLGVMDGGKKTFDCMCNVSMVCMSLRSIPSLTIVTKCLNEKCGAERSISHPYLEPQLKSKTSVYDIEHLLSDFFEESSIKCKTCNMEAMQRTPVIGPHIFIQVDALQDGSMQVINPKIDTAFKIDRLPEDVLFQGKRFVLAGVVQYLESYQHYTAFVRKAGGQWELYDDLLRFSQANPSLQCHVNPHLIVYVIKD